MKAEHRKALETNTLADTIGRWFQRLKNRPRPSPNGLVVTGFVVLAAGLFIGWRYYANVSHRERSQLWVQLEEATGPGDLEDIVNSHPKTTAALVARFQRARVLLQSGLERVYSEGSREDALKQLKEAEGLYEELVKPTEDRPVLHQEALRGVAKAREGRGELEGAVEYYEKLAAKYPNTPQGEKAAEQAKLLQSAEGRELYARLNQLATDRAKGGGLTGNNLLPDWLR